MLSVKLIMILIIEVLIGGCVGLDVIVVNCFWISFLIFWCKSFIFWWVFEVFIGNVLNIIFSKV